MLQDPLSKPPDVQMEMSRGPCTDHSRRNKPNSASSEQVLKCPRCDSLNTKFCYFNNYSLTQPRHFCKNCRRYWTQGGSLRNVPIGGGCRKNKRVKQRAVDPQLFGGLDDHSSFLQHAAGSGAAGSLLSNSCFAGRPPNSSVPGFDLIPNSDSHLLSMAFSRLQESIRLSNDQESGAVAIGAKQLSLMHPATLYDNPSLDLIRNSYIKPEHHYMQILNGTELGNSSLFEHPASSSAHLTSSASAAAGLALEQLSNFGIPSVDGFPAACGSQLADAQLRLVQQERQQPLALHLGAAASEHHMPNPTSCSSTGGSGAAADDNGTRSHHRPEHYIDFHNRHLVLPDFEDQESPESMSSIMVIRRGHHADKLVKGSAMNMESCSTSVDKRSLGIDSWHQMSTSHDQQQFSGEARKAATYHDSQAVTNPSSPGDQQAHVSFWSPSPWNTNQDVHTGALL